MVVVLSREHVKGEGTKLSRPVELTRVGVSISAMTQTEAGMLEGEPTTMCG